MEISNDGKLVDLQNDEGVLLMLTIYAILFLEWLPLLKENFKKAECEFFGTAVFEGLFWQKLTKEELIDLLYAMEFELGILEPSLCRSELMANKIMSLEPMIQINRSRTDPETMP